MTTTAHDRPPSTTPCGAARGGQCRGIEAPVCGGNLLRHSLATELLAGGVGLHEIADLFGHSSLATTRICAAVDIGRLREVGLPRPSTGTQS